MSPKLFQQITYWPIYLALKLLVHYRIEGQENLKGLEDKPVIFASNHASYIDGSICAAAMPHEGWVPDKFFPIRFLAAKEYCEFRNPKNFPFPISLFTTAYVKLNGSVPVIRGGVEELSVKLSEAVKALQNGAKLWIYPEGRITKTGKLQLGKKGMIYLHQATGAAIVPVALIGTFKILSLKTLFGLTRVKVKIGKPIYSLTNVFLEKGTEIVMKEIENLI